MPLAVKLAAKTSRLGVVATLSTSFYPPYLLARAWGSAYLIGYDDEHGWWASRRDQIGGLLTEAGPDQLRAAIIADYEMKPVPRDCATTAGSVP